EVWHVFVLSVAIGIINAFDMPARQAFVVELVEREDLTNALALNSFLINSSRIVGPAVAGFVVGLWGEGPAFILNALSFLAVMVSLELIRTGPRAPDSDAAGADAWHHALRGVRYAWAHPGMRAMILLLAAIGFFGMPYLPLMPIFSDGILHAGP